MMPLWPRPPPQPGQLPLATGSKMIRGHWLSFKFILLQPCSDFDSTTLWLKVWGLKSNHLCLDSVSTTNCGLGQAALSLLSLSFLIFLLAVLGGMQDLSSPQGSNPCHLQWKRGVFNHWTARELPVSSSCRWDWSLASECCRDD